MLCSSNHIHHISNVCYGCNLILTIALLWQQSAFPSSVYSIIAVVLLVAE